jgi:leader peptidase (prepilin peptidase)/N-methyltransferase
VSDTWPWVVGSALVCAALALGLPGLVAALPERNPDASPTYAQVASARGLAWWLAAVAAVAGGLFGHARAAQPDLPAFLALAVLGTGMGYVDVRRHLLPDRFTVPTLLVGAVLLGAAALVPSVDPAASYPRAWACAGAMMLLYLLLALVYPAGLGLGDVKLAGPLGLYLGWLGWSTAAVGLFAAFLVGGLVGVVLLASGRAGRRTAVPFGPSMLVGALLAVLWAEPVTAWYLR